MILLNDESNEHIVCFYRDLTGYWYRFLLPAYSAMSVKGRAGMAERLLNYFLQIVCK